MALCDTVAQHPLPCKSQGHFQMFKISVSEFGTPGRHRRFRICACEFVTTVSKGVVHGVHKVVIRPSFGVIR